MSFDFEYCPVGQLMTRTFSFVNTLPIPLKYTIDVDGECPFKFDNPRGVLRVKQKKEITISY
jgi:hypothetical protein